MRLGLLLRYKGDGGLRMDLVHEAEKLGFASVWSSEAYGSDAVSPVAWVLAQTSRIKAGTGIMQMPARTPACAAMTAIALQAMSGNRFIMGIGPSGPQVVEGWHGVAYGKPLTRTKEYIAIVRQIFAREAPLQFKGEHYQIPYTGPGATGLGKPLKSIAKPSPDLKIYTAAIAPAGLRTAGEAADGVLPIFINPEKPDEVANHVLDGMAAAGRPRSLENFDIAPYVRVAMGPDLQKCRDALKPELALYIGGMGARSKNFYNDYVRRLGYEAEAVKIQDAYLAGRKEEAMAMVPDKLIDDTALVGPPERIKDRVQAWKQGSTGNRIGTLLLGGADAEAMRVIAEAAG